MDNNSRTTRFAMLGLGQMAEALVGGFIRSKVLHPSSFFGTDVSASRREVLAGRFGIKVGDKNRDAVAWADTILLAVKPQNLGAVLGEIGPSLSNKLVISIAAGIPIRWIADRIHQEARIIRVMPNAPALIGKGMAVLSCAAGVREEEVALTRVLFDSVGKTVVLEEALMDVVTGLSGSGPAFAYIALEAMADGGVKMGLPRYLAETMAAQTLLGASKLFLDPSLSQLSLGGVDSTLGASQIAGVNQLHQCDVRNTLISGVDAAAHRSAELGRTCL